MNVDPALLRLLRQLSDEVDALQREGRFDQEAFERIWLAALALAAALDTDRAGDSLGFLHRAARPDWLVD